MEDDDLRAELERLRTELRSVHERLDALEARVGTSPETGSGDSRSSDEEGLTDVGRAATERSAVDEGRAPDERTGASAPLSSSTSTSAGTADGEEKPDRQSRIGAPAKWFGWVGILALVVGVVLLVRYAIDAGYLDHRARILLAVGAGVGLVAIGRVVGERDRYELWARTVTGGGLAIAYFGIYAAYGLESYREALGLPLWPILVLLVAVVVLTVALALDADSRVIAYEALLFGYVAVWLCFEFGALALVASLLLAAGTVALCARRPWIELALGGAVGTYAVYLAWFDGPGEAFVPGAPYLLAAFTLFLAVPPLLRPVTDGPWRVSGGRWTYLVPTLTVFNALAFTILFDVLLRETYPDLRSGFFLALAVCFAVASLSRARTHGRPSVYLSVFFAVLATVVQFSTFWVTVLCVALIPVLVVVAHRLDEPDVRYAAYAVTAFVVAKLVTVDVNELPAGSLDAPFAMARPWSFLTAILVFAGLSWFLSRPDGWLTDRERSGSVTVPIVYAWLATALALFLTGVELAGVQVSITWALVGLGLLAGAIRFGRDELRQQSVAVLGLTAFKVFLFDTADLDPLPRTLSFLALGILLLVAAFVYTRYVRDDGETEDSTTAPGSATDR